MYWWLASFILLLFFISTVLLIIHNSLVIVNVKGLSMSPTLTDGDRVLVLRHWPSGWLRKNQIVLVWPWQETNRDNKSKQNLFTVIPYIKRIMGLPGDRLVTKITDLEKHERIHYLSMHNEMGERVWNIPEGHFFVKGDYPLSGNDSLIWGAIPFKCFWGLVLTKLPSTATNK